MIPIQTNLPDWTASITIIIFILVFGRIFITKITTLIKNMLNSFKIDEEINKNFIGLISSLFWLLVFGLVLSNFPRIFTPDVFPVREVGSILLRFVGYAFGLILPIVLLLFFMEYKKK